MQTDLAQVGLLALAALLPASGCTSARAESSPPFDAAERSAELERDIVQRARRLLAEPARHFTGTLRAWYESAGSA